MNGYNCTFYVCHRPVEIRPPCRQSRSLLASVVLEPRRIAQACLCTAAAAAALSRLALRFSPVRRRLFYCKTWQTRHHHLCEHLGIVHDRDRMHGHELETWFWLRSTSMESLFRAHEARACFCLLKVASSMVREEDAKTAKELKLTAFCLWIKWASSPSVTRSFSAPWNAFRHLLPPLQMEIEAISWNTREDFQVIRAPCFFSISRATATIFFSRWRQKWPLFCREHFNLFGLYNVLPFS